MTPAAQQRIPIFAYGTLRPGCGNDRMLGDYIHLGQGHLHGALRYHLCGQFPVYRPDDVEGYGGRVLGDVLLAEQVYADEVMSMEVHAGYDAVWADVTVVDEGELRSFECLTFPWNRPEYGELIESGDWTTTPQGIVRQRQRAYELAMPEEDA